MCLSLVYKINDIIDAKFILIFTIYEWIKISKVIDNV